MNNNTKHTHGPWKAYGLAIYTESRRPHWVSGMDARASLIANVRDNDDGDPENETDNPPFMAEAEANASLIAAAPELLEALEAIKAHWDAGNFSRQPHLYEPMNKAIAKAKGEA